MWHAVAHRKHRFRKRRPSRDEAELEHVFEKASKMERNAAEAEAYFRFAERLRYEVTKRSRINFKVFVLCWTGNN